MGLGIAIRKSDHKYIELSTFDNFVQEQLFRANSSTGWDCGKAIQCWQERKAVLRDQGLTKLDARQAYAIVLDWAHQAGGPEMMEKILTRYKQPITEGRLHLEALKTAVGDARLLEAERLIKSFVTKLVAGESTEQSRRRDATPRYRDEWAKEVLALARKIDECRKANPVGFEAALEKKATILGKSEPVYLRRFSKGLKEFDQACRQASESDQEEQRNWPELVNKLRSYLDLKPYDDETWRVITGIWANDSECDRFELAQKLETVVRIACATRNDLHKQGAINQLTNLLGEPSSVDELATRVAALAEEVKEGGTQLLMQVEPIEREALQQPIIEQLKNWFKRTSNLNELAKMEVVAKQIGRLLDISENRLNLAKLLTERHGELVGEYLGDVSKRLSEYPGSSDAFFATELTSLKNAEDELAKEENADLKHSKLHKIKDKLRVLESLAKSEQKRSKSAMVIGFTAMPIAVVLGGVGFGIAAWFALPGIALLAIMVVSCVLGYGILKLALTKRDDHLIENSTMTALQNRLLELHKLLEAQRKRHV